MCHIPLSTPNAHQFNFFFTPIPFNPHPKTHNVEEKKNQAPFPHFHFKEFTMLKKTKSKPPLPLHFKEQQYVNI